MKAFPLGTLLTGAPVTGAEQKLLHRGEAFFLFCQDFTSKTLFKTHWFRHSYDLGLVQNC